MLINDPSSRGALRRALELFLRTVSDLDDFLLDHFLPLYNQISSGMDWASRVNLLLSQVAPEDVMRALRMQLNQQEQVQLRTLLTQPTEDSSWSPEEFREKTAPPLLFLEYAEEEQELVDELLLVMAPLLRAQLLRVFSRRDIHPDEVSQQVLDTQLACAAVIVPIISPSLLASRRFEQFQHQAELLSSSGRTVIPLLARPALWEKTQLGKLQPLPSDQRFLTTNNRKERENVLVTIAKALATAAEAAAQSRNSMSVASATPLAVLASKL